MTRYLNSRMLEGAQAYAAADRSDPFTYARCRTHLLNGVASLHNAQGQDAFYSADAVEETRPDGREYHVTAYRNITRP